MVRSLGKNGASRAALAASAAEKAVGKAAGAQQAGKSPRFASVGGKAPRLASAPVPTPQRKVVPVGANLKGGARKRRTKQGNKTLRDIKFQQESIRPVIPLASFVRVLREVLHTVSPLKALRIQKQAVLALREQYEAEQVRLFMQANRLTMHCRHKLLMARDLKHHLNTLKEEGIYIFTNGPTQPEQFPMGKGVVLQQLFGHQQQKEYREAKRILNVRAHPAKPRVKKEKKEADADAVADEEAPDEDEADEPADADDDAQADDEDNEAE